MGINQKNYYIREKVVGNCLHLTNGTNLYYLPTLVGGVDGVSMSGKFLKTHLFKNNRETNKVIYINCTVRYNKRQIPISIYE